MIEDEFHDWQVVDSNGNELDRARYMHFPSNPIGNGMFDGSISISHYKELDAKYFKNAKLFSGEHRFSYGQQLKFDFSLDEDVGADSYQEAEPLTDFGSGMERLPDLDDNFIPIHNDFAVGRTDDDVCFVSNYHPSFNSRE